MNKPVEIADGFNDHFSTIAKKLTNKLPSSPTKFTDYLPPSNPSVMFMTPANIAEIKRLIYELKPKLQGWKLKPKPKPENPVLKDILETETETYLAKILKT